MRVVLVGRQKSLMISRRARHPVMPGRAPEMGAFRQRLQGRAPPLPGSSTPKPFLATTQVESKFKS